MARGLALSIMDHQLDEFRNYLNGMEQYVKAQAKAVESRLEEEFKKWSGRDFSEAQEHEWTMYYQDETWPVESVFPRILRNSFFLTIYAYLEGQLVTICGRLNKRFSLAQSWEGYSPKEGVLERAKKYLKKEAKLKLWFDKSQWNEIQNYKKIRHYLVHRTGKVGNDPSGIREYLFKRDLIEKNLDEIFLTKDFCMDTIANVRCFLIDLNKAVSTRLQSSNC